MSKESYTKNEIKIINKNRIYKIIRLLFKISIIFLMGIILMFPFLIIIYMIPLPTELHVEIGNFFRELPVFWQYFSRWEISFLIIFATILPFSLLFLSRVNWSAYNLTYSQWSSILTIIEPIGGIFFGVLIVNEYFPSGYLTIVLLLLIISILLRYAHETKNKVNAIIILHKKQEGLRV